MVAVYSVSKSGEHTFSKKVVDSVSLIENEGVKGDAHCGRTVKHRSRVRRDPDQPNLRQVHLISHELIQELLAKGFEVGPASMGENITTVGIDLLALPKNTALRFPSGAEIVVTGLRNPCHQLDDYQKGLTAAVLDRNVNGELIRKAGVMAVVRNGGVVAKGDQIDVRLPEEPYEKLEKV
ncbi:MAG: MOSC domain-containing protein [Gammaproteobacteria bacterium]|nr:MOSC domain-containing protein [Gammaproteobacteria bacterium]